MAEAALRRLHWVQSVTLARLDQTDDVIERHDAYHAMSEKLRLEDGAAQQEEAIQAMRSSLAALAAHLRRDLASKDTQLCVPRTDRGRVSGSRQGASEPYVHGGLRPRMGEAAARS